MIGLLSRHILESTLFCILLGGLAHCLRRHGAAARHTLWLIGISKFCIPTVLLSVTGARIAFLIPAASWVSAFVAKLSAAFAVVFRFFPASIQLGDSNAASIAVVSVWMTGAAAMFVAWLFQLQRSDGHLVLSSTEELEALDRVKNLLSIRTPIRLRSSDRAREPSLFGIVHPTITIPNGLYEQLTPSEFETVLLHELAHTRRRDNLSAAFIHFLVCLFWFHPLLWLVEKFLVAERERACDEMVIRCGTAPQVYIAGILKVCRFHVFECVGGIPGTSQMTHSDLKGRLDLIRSCHSYKPIPAVFRVLLAGLAVFITILPIAGGYCQECLSNGQDPVVSSGKKAPTHLPNTSHRRSLLN